MSTGIPTGREAMLEPPSVLIADDDAAYRRGVRESLETYGFLVVAEVSDVATAIAAVGHHAPDVCLLELELPGDGLRAIPRLAKAAPSTLVIVLTGAAHAEDVVIALERGASGFLLKELSGDRLASTLRAALRGEPAVSRALVSRLVDEIRRVPARQLALPGGPVTLTPREWEVGEMLREGHSTEEIAVRLGVSPVTVRRHVGLLLRKLGAPDRAAAIDLLRAFGRR
jgi:DNA-binding NarL/FixJ family response regulator